MEVVAKEISATEGNLISSFCLVSNGDCRFNIVSIIGVTGSDEVSSVQVDEYTHDLATALASSS